MKGCFVLPHKEMKKANKGFNVFYGSQCWASPVSSCPAQTEPLGTGIHPWGWKTFPGRGLRVPSLFSLGRGSLGHLVSSLLVAFRPVLSSLFSTQRRSSKKGASPQEPIPGVVGCPCKRAARGFDPTGVPLPLGTPQTPVQPP